MVTSPHENDGQYSPCPSAAATGNGKDKATHTDDETRKSSNKDGAMESLLIRRWHWQDEQKGEPLTDTGGGWAECKW